jgi:hypothetical protein
LPDFNRDVVNVAASYRANTPDPSAASFLRALRHANEAQTDIRNQGQVTSLLIDGQEFASLRYQQIRDDGEITYESAFATAIRGFVVFFVFGSVSNDSLAQMQQSMQTFVMSDHCNRLAPEKNFTSPSSR